MSVIDWGNSTETIMVWRIDRNWSSHNFEQDLQAIQRLIDTQHEEVCLIIDVKQYFPPVSFFQALTVKLQKGIDAQITTLVVIVPSATLDLLSFPRGLPRHCKFYTVDTADKAYAIAEPYNANRHDAFV